METYGKFRARRLPEVLDGESDRRVDPVGLVRLPELKAAIEALKIF